MWEREPSQQSARVSQPGACPAELVEYLRRSDTLRNRRNVQKACFKNIDYCKRKFILQNQIKRKLERRDACSIRNS